MVKITSDSIKKIERYVDNGFIKQSIYSALLKAVNKEDFVSVMKSSLDADDKACLLLWGYIINIMWQKENDIFDKPEIMLIREMLKCDGVVLRSKIKKIFNEYLARKSIENMTEKGVIDVIELESNEKIIMLNPKFVRKVYDAK